MFEYLTTKIHTFNFPDNFFFFFDFDFNCCILELLTILFSQIYVFDAELLIRIWPAMPECERMTTQPNIIIESADDTDCIPMFNILFIHLNLSTVYSCVALFFVFGSFFFTVASLSLRFIVIYFSIYVFANKIEKNAPNNRIFHVFTRSHWINQFQFTVGSLSCRTVDMNYH